MPASEYRALQNQVRELQRLLGKKTMESEILMEALEIAGGPKKQMLRALSLRKEVLGRRPFARPWVSPGRISLRAPQAPLPEPEDGRRSRIGNWWRKSRPLSPTCPPTAIGGVQPILLTLEQVAQPITGIVGCEPPQPKHTPKLSYPGNRFKSSSAIASRSFLRLNHPVQTDRTQDPRDMPPELPLQERRGLHRLICNFRENPHAEKCRSGSDFVSDLRSRSAVPGRMRKEEIISAVSSFRLQRDR